MKLAVITPVHGRHDHLLRQQNGLAASTRRPDQFILATMDDPDAGHLTRQRPPASLPVPVSTGKTGRLPLARARNTGARAALDDGAELLVFLDVDCIPGPETLHRYADTAADGTLLSGTVHYLPPPPPGGYRLDDLDKLAPHPHSARPNPPSGTVADGGDPRLFWSLSFAVTATTWERIGGFCEDYEGYGAEDTDYGLTAATRGVDLRWLGGAPAYHQHHAVSRPPVEHLDDILRNAGIFHRRWGFWPMEGWLRQFCAMGLIHYRGDAWERTSAACAQAVTRR